MGEILNETFGLGGQYRQVKSKKRVSWGKDGGIGGGQNGVGILRCHSEEFDKGGIFGGDQASWGV